MKKDKVNKLLDFIPLAILIAFAIHLIWVRINEQVLFAWQHWTALSLLFLDCLLFRRNHQLGVLGLGMTLLIGLFGIAQFSPGVSFSQWYWTPNGAQIPLFYGQPIFILWLIIHFVISRRYYFGIATKKYWQNLK